MPTNEPYLTKLLNFLRTTKRAYGEDKALDVWTSVSKILDDDELTLNVMQNLLSGEYAGTKIILTQWDDFPANSQVRTYNSNKIPAIKTFREWTGCGLIEAKNAVEAAASGGRQEFEIAKHHYMVYNDDNTFHTIDIDYNKLLNDFKSVGLTVEIE